MQNLLILVLMSLKYSEDGRLRNNTKRVDLLNFKTAFFSKNMSSMIHLHSNGKMLIHNYLWGLLAILKGDILIHSWLNGLLAILMTTCLL